MGTVKRCQNIKTSEYFAVKIIKSRDDELVCNVKKEFEKLKKLEHENIISVHELIIDRLLGAIYLVMELFDGREMFELLSDVGYYNGDLNRKGGQVSFQTAGSGHQVPA